jgi:type IX secretion system PorP/SprF family membrane protein
MNNTTHNLLFQMARHYFITGGANLFQTNTWEIKPSFLVKTDGTITTLDLNVTAVYKNRFWIGTSYRYQDAVCPMAGFLIPGSTGNKDLGLKVGFAYDYTTSHLKNYSNGTFELFLNYCIPTDWIPGWHRDVRIFN